MYIVHLYHNNHMSIPWLFRGYPNSWLSYDYPGTIIYLSHVYAMFIP